MKNMLCVNHNISRFCHKLLWNMSANAIYVLPQPCINKNIYTSNEDMGELDQYLIHINTFPITSNNNKLDA